MPSGKPPWNYGVEVMWNLVGIPKGLPIPWNLIRSTAISERHFYEELIFYLIIDQIKCRKKWDSDGVQIFEVGLRD